MDKPFSGGCACRRVRYECSSEPRMSFNCHCRDCQRASGSAYAALLFVPAAALRLVAGEPRYHTVAADSGHAVSRGFCPACGSPILGKIAEKPEIMVVMAGGLDDPSMYQPAMEVYASSAQPWDVMHPSLPRHAKTATK